ncbi:MAG: UPF0158 family protein [Planctomycetota bacterium]
MFVASSILTFMGLMAFAAAAALAYFFIPRRPPAARKRPQQAAPAAPAPAPGEGDLLAAAPPARLSLRAVIDRMVNVGDDESTFLDPTGNRLVTLGDQLLAVLEDDEPIEEAIDFSPEELEDLRSKLKSKRLLPLPTKAETNEFQLQERFCDELPDGEAKEQMLKVLLGQTGFRSFDGAVKRLGIEEAWRRLRDAEYARIATAWLEKNEISFDREVRLPDEPDQELRQAS